jgi:hypothetical protein
MIGTLAVTVLGSIDNSEGGAANTAVTIAMRELRSEIGYANQMNWKLQLALAAAVAAFLTIISVRLPLATVNGTSIGCGVDLPSAQAGSKDMFRSITLCDESLGTSDSRRQRCWQ